MKLHDTAFGEKLALVSQEYSLTYSDLQSITNKKARLLCEQYNIAPGDHVGLLVDDKVNAIIWIISILKAGATYVVLDSKWPENRIKKSIEIANLKALITDEMTIKIYAEAINLNLFIDNLDEASSFCEDYNLLEIDKQSLAYIVFTSGSTGSPKGVKMSHSALLKYLDWEISYRSNQTKENVLQFFPLCFDISFQEFFATLVVGGTVIVIPENLKHDISSFLGFINNKNVQRLYLPYAFLVEMAEYCQQNNTYPSLLHQIISSGEKLLVTQSIKKLFTHLPKCKLINLYGASEIQVISIHELTGSTNSWPDVVPIGTAIAPVQIFILDEEKKIVNEGVGEIYIESDCLTSGYITDDDSQHEKFSQLFINGSLRKLYCIGDLARRNCDGVIEYKGRKDLQVKIRGYRIELGEIDQVITRHPVIQQSVTLSIGEQEKYKRLVSYVVSNELQYNKNSKVDSEIILDPADKLEFKLEKHNINSTISHIGVKFKSLNFQDNYVAYFSRKSYRTYQGTGIDQDNFVKLFNNISMNVKQNSKIKDINISAQSCLKNEKIFDIELLEQVLSLLAALQCDGKMLPKYRYPSAGSLYPVQTYIEIGTDSIGIEPGYYYYNPEKHTIYKISNNDRLGGFKFYFVGKLSAIQPLYGSMSRAFCFIELGYMLGLINTDFKSRKLTLQASNDIADSSIASHLKLNWDHIILGVYEFSRSNNINPDLLPEIYVFIKTPMPQFQMGWYKYNYDTGCLNFLNNDKPFQMTSAIDENYSIYYEADFAIFFMASNHNLNSLEEAQINTGVISHLIGQNSIQGKIGLCPIGTLNTLGKECLAEITTGTFIQGIFGGSITAEQISEHEQSFAKELTATLSDELHKHVAKYLPEYMCPAEIIFLEHLPLTLNGKIDKNKLVQLNKVGDEICVQPRNEFERDMVQLWADLFRLDTSKIGVTTDFFKLGGDSILSIRLVGKIRQHLGISISSNDIYKWKTIEKLYNNIISKSQKEAFHDPKVITNPNVQKNIGIISESHERAKYVEENVCTNLTLDLVDNIISQEYLDSLMQRLQIQNIYLANSLQQGFIYHALNQGYIDDAYIVQRIWRYRACLDLDKLKLAWESALKKYPSLRLSFAWEDELVQIVNKVDELDWRFIDLSDVKLDEEQQILRIKELIKSDREEKYDLNKGRLFRLYLIRHSSHFYTFLFSHHHAILDGWSNSILFKYIHNTYLDLISGKTKGIDFDKSYGQSQQYLQTHRADHLDYWRNKISQIEEKIDLNGLLLNRNKNLSEYRYITSPKEKHFEIKESLYHHLKYLSQRQGITLNSILQFAWHRVLHIYGNSKHTVVGTILSGRNLPVLGIEDSVGMYINTLPLIVDHAIHDQQSIIISINMLQESINEMNSKAGVELSKLQKDSRRIFEVLFTYENYPDFIDDDYNNILNISRLESIEKLDYPLAFIALDTKKELVCNIKYAGELFFENSILQLFSTFEMLLHQIATNTDQKGRDLTYYENAVFREIFHVWDCADHDVETLSILQQFKAQVKKGPDRIAVVYGCDKITYNELDIKSGQVARILQENGISRNDLVGIYLDRSHLMIIGMMGILKSGGAYVPLDSVYPIDRINYMLQDANARVVLSTKKLAKNIPGNIKIIFLDEDEIYQGLQVKPTLSRGQDAIYALFTSGSTGKPKASIVYHAGFLNLLSWYLRLFNLNEQDKVLIISSIGFDLTQKNIWGMLMCGGQIHLLQSELYDATKINEQLENHSITLLNCAPSAFYGLLEEPSLLYQLKSLKRVVLGGEPILTERLKLIVENDLHFQIINTYGPTECSDISNFYILTNDDIKNNAIIPIGKPIDHVKVYIANPHMQLLPPGAIGELYIGGKSVGQGYLNKPTLTAEKFVPNPFQTDEEIANDENERIYRTGDLVRWMIDGNIEFVGRVDFQVKMRGFRIELGEIEATLQSIPSIKQTLVLLREDIINQKRLIAYITLEKFEIRSSSESDTIGKYELQKREIVKQARDVCRSRLPDYMQPSKIIIIEALPLTPNGKIDRKALPSPEDVEEMDSYDAPIGTLETTLAEIWKDILKQEKIGRHDNFFSLGGDSIVSIQMVSRAKKKGILFDIRQVFNHPTIAGIIAHLSNKTDSMIIDLEENSGLVPLLPIQQLFFAWADNVHYFNQAHWIFPCELLNSNGYKLNEKVNVNLDRLLEVFKTLHDYHDAFKLCFKKVGQKWEQYYSENSQFSFEVLNKNQWSFDNLLDICNTIQSTLNIERGPISRIVWFEGLGMFWVIHHLVIDGVSWRILVEDLNVLYEQRSLPSKGSSYKSWSQYLYTYERLDTAYQYYKDFPSITLPCQKYKERVEYQIKLSKKVTQNFIQQAQRAYNTQPNDLLLTALMLTLGKESNYQLSIDLEGHGREMLDSELDITRTIGWFTTVFPVYLKLSSPGDLDKSIREIKEQLRAVPEKGITYGILTFIKQRISEISTDISFNYLGQWDTLVEESSTFKLGDQLTGKCHEGNANLFHTLDILGEIKEGELRFVWASNLGDSKTAELILQFQENLELIIDFCMNKDSYRFTPSDFLIKDIDQEELDHILNS